MANTDDSDMEEERNGIRRDEYEDWNPKPETRATFTPGPWSMARAPRYPGDTEARWDVGPGDSSGIANVEGTANARLIAAAPSLYAALRELVEADPYDFGAVELSDLQDKAREAIRLVDGEA